MPSRPATRVAIFDAYPVVVGGSHAVARDVWAAGIETGRWSTTVVVLQDLAVARWLRERDVPVEVVAAPAGLMHFGGTWQRHLLAMAAALPRAWWRLRSALAGYDVVHIHDFRGLVLAGPAAVLARRPIVVHVHHGENGGRAWRAVAGLLIRRRVPVIVPSRSGASSWCGRHGDDLVELPNPVRVLERTAEAPTATVVTLARLDRDKGLDVLMRAMDRVTARIPDARLVIAGGPSPGQEELVARLRDQAEASTHTTLAGFVPDVTTVLAGAWVYAQPSRREPFGLAALEASAAGLPVVASRVGGLLDVVQEGRTGVLVPPGDPDALADALVALLEEPERRAALGTNGQQRARTEFGLAAFAARLDAVYRSRARR